MTAEFGEEHAVLMPRRSAEIHVVGYGTTRDVLSTALVTRTSCVSEFPLASICSVRQ